MKSSQYVALFVDEATLLIEQCHNCLEQLERDQTEASFYREFFRLIHTIKGMASTLTDLPYFNDMTYLSHCIETLLEQYHQLLVQEQLFLLSDSLRALSDLNYNVSYPEQANPVSLEPLYVRFRQSIQIDPFSPVQTNLIALPDSRVLQLNETEWAQIEDFQRQGYELFEVEIELMRACLMKSVRALLVMHKLEAHSHFISSIPSMELIREGVFQNTFSLLLASQLGPEELHELAESVSEIEQVNVRSFNPNDYFQETSDEEDSSDSEQDELNEFEIRLLEEATKLDLNAIWLSFQEKQSVQLRSARIALIFQCLENYGEVIKTRPGVQELELENFDGQFDLLVISSLSPDVLKKHILKEADIQNWLELSAYLHGHKPQFKSGLIDLSEPLELAATEQSEPERLKSTRAQALVRVDADQLHLLNKLSHQLMILTNQFNQELHQPGLEQSLQHLNHLSANLQTLSMKLQTTTMHHIFHRYPRMIRDLARSLNKEIDCHLQGEEVELSRDGVDELSSVLLHMVRNAVDHGMEAPEERLLLGKSRQGSIHLSAEYLHKQIVIEVKDDGRGIDVDALKSKAQQQKLFSQEELAEMSHEQALQLIFSPGLSTSTITTEISGRGIGMDAVLNHVQQLGGSIKVSSQRSKGTTFKIYLPTDLWLSQVLLIRAATQFFALPFVQIKQICFANELSDIEPGLDLKSFKMEQNGTGLIDTSVLVKLDDGSKNLWLRADELVGSLELLIRPIHNARNDFISGIATLSLDEIAQFIETDKLLQSFA